MDRNTVTGLILIFVIMLAWFYFMAPSEEELKRRQAEQVKQDSIAAAQADTNQPDEQAATPSPTQQQQQKQQKVEEQSDKPQVPELFAKVQAKDTSRVTIETPLYQSEFTNLGAGPSQFTLKKYSRWDDTPVQMLNDTTQSAYSLGFITTGNMNVETSDLLFHQQTSTDRIQLGENEQKQLTYKFTLENGQTLTYTYTFYGNSYRIDLSIDLDRLTEQIAGNNVDFRWNPALRHTEKNKSQENQSMSSYVFMGGEMIRFKQEEAGRQQKNYNGSVRWVSSRNKFFTQIIKPTTSTDGARLTGEVSGNPEKATTEHRYSTTIRSDIPDDRVIGYQLYVGPLHYQDLKTFDSHAYDMVNVGFSWIRWFSDPLVRYIIIPFFSFLSNYVGNYGLIIILFAVAIKGVLYPLTKKSFKSMAAMRELQPELKEIQEKYEDNPQKQQKETMKLYKKADVNPLGGCLPTLLQFPVLITLYRFFQNSILIRQKSFLWVNDLSAPDMLINLPFSIPFLGDHLGGFVILMSASMAVQTQMTSGATGGGGAGGPSMKSFQYILPFILLFVFNNFAAGLSLYYLFFNALSIIQQFWINKQLDQEKVHEKVATNN
mgnify:CR=1 FL=1